MRIVAKWFDNYERVDKMVVIFQFILVQVKSDPQLYAVVLDRDKIKSVPAIELVVLPSY